MDSDEDEGNFARQGGQAIDLEGDFDSEEEVDDEMDDDDDEMPQPQQQVQQQPPRQQPPKQQPQQKGPSPGKKPGDVKGQVVDNQPFDLAVEVNDSEEIDSDEEGDEVHVGGPQQQQQQQQQKQNQQPAALQKKQVNEDDDDDEEEKAAPGAYNPAEYANLQVSSEVKDLFEYIQRYKPQKIDLDTKLKPFIPEYIPCVGEVDSFLKMPKPDGTKEDLGIIVLDEPSLNHEDKTVIELRYIQERNVVRATPMNVESIEHADKKPKEISRWIKSVQDLHKTRPPPTVNYTKQMPDIETLMQEWSPDMEQALREIPFPGPDIDMHPSDYARLICSMVDIPCHKLANNKSVVESLHVLFTLFSEFRSNQHFQNQNQDGMAGGDIGTF
ncbi:intraflagellar transport protein 46 homolog [Stylonychia lemnae]|uniref:Intraflagellar transport protein 46 homolog n=1 Tax=Stylonychia lemnae TaxID=5949 RepID=A0A078A6V9_STYLE|nr:intraflagellar transport protein 46 homolog [Stylonychia lemnae]|eukprot:CDW77990.1 intraflagellar transport protein 46 homolog [Stylonychia lemnae]